MVSQGEQMLDIKGLKQALTILVPPTLYEHGELDRLLAAAAVNAQFCARLLEDPLAAIREGFQGESFQLSDEEAAVLLCVGAHSLSELAEGVARYFSEPQTLSMPISAPSLVHIGR
jgi:hypothetical protein